MPGVGSAFVYEDLGSCTGGNSTIALSGAGSPVADKFTLVSVIDINRGSNWLGVLDALCGFTDSDLGFSTLPPSVELVTVIFERTGGAYTNLGYVEAATAVGGYSNLVANSILQRDDGTYVGSTLAADYPGPDIDTDSDCYWCYFVGKNGVTAGNTNNAVADIWRRDVVVEDADGIPISTLPLLTLDKAGVPVTGFDGMGNPQTGGSDPVDFTPLSSGAHDAFNIRAFFIQLLKNLAGTPRVLGVGPEPGTWRRDLPSTSLYFSQPLDPIAATAAAAYSLTGASGSLAIVSRDYSQLDNAANAAVLGLTGFPDDTGTDKTFGIEIAVPVNTYGIAPTGADSPSTAEWEADVTPPAVSFSSPADGASVYGASVSVLLSGNDPPGEATPRPAVSLATIFRTVAGPCR